jgi:hypothetical protein
LSTPRKTSAALLLALPFFVAACGDKLPESEASRKLGEQPKQLLNKVESDVNKSLQKGMEQRTQAEKKE